MKLNDKLNNEIDIDIKSLTEFYNFSTDESNDGVFMVNVVGNKTALPVYLNSNLKSIIDDENIDTKLLTGSKNERSPLFERMDECLKIGTLYSYAARLNPTKQIDYSISLLPVKKALKVVQIIGIVSEIKQEQQVIDHNPKEAANIGYWTYEIKTNLISPDMQTRIILDLDTNQMTFSINELNHYLLDSPWENEEYTQKNYFHFIENLTTTNAGNQKFLRKYVYANYDNDELIGYSGYVQDITKEYEGNIQKEKSANSLEYMLCNAYDIIIQVTPDLHITHNSNYNKTSSQNQPNISEYVHPDDLDKVLAYIKKQSNGPLLIRTLRKDGYRWLRWHMSIVKDDKGNIKYYNGIGHDVHKKTLAELKLNYKYDLLTQTMESAQIGVYEFNLESHEFLPTSIWRKMMGYADTENIDRLSLYKKLLNKNDFEKYKRMFNACLSGTLDKYSLELILKDADGNIKYIKDEGHPVEYRNGKPCRILGLCLDITERRKAEHLLEYKLNHDQLTGLSNRYMLHNSISEAMNFADENYKATGIFIDLDNFKMVNDMYGHDAGDTCIKLVSDILRKHAPKTSTIARLSGDEFFIYIENTTDKEQMSNLTNNIIKEISINASPSDKEDLQVNASAGIAFYPSQAKDRRHLLSFADMAMYYSKMNGKNQITIYSDEIGKSTMQNYSYALQMTSAIKNEEFILHYQPVVNITTDEIISIEALVRWEHPSRGLLMPSAFINIAEFNGIIQKLGLWTIKTAIDQLNKWRNTNLKNIPVSVNISSLELSGINLGNYVVDMLDKYDLPGNMLQIELMDNGKIKSSINIKTNLKILRARGCLISVDNFGMDYASLSMLNSIDFDVIKLDKYFSDNLKDSRLNVMLMKLMQSICKEYKKSCIVVGVEDQDQLNTLKNMGFNYLQGYHLGRPMSEAELMSYNDLKQAR